jgi:hypothetical protein
MLLKINNETVPQDFIDRHGDPRMVPGFDQSSCKCGVDFVAVGAPEVLVRTPAFKTHILKAFRSYKAKHRQLLGGDVSG